MKLRVEQGRHYALPFLVGIRFFRRFREVFYSITNWNLEYPYENSDSLDQNKLVGVNLRGFRSSNLDSVMLSSAHDSKAGITTFAAYANNSELRSEKNPKGYEILPLFELENGRFNGVGDVVKTIDVSIRRNSYRYISLNVEVYGDGDALIKEVGADFRISDKAAKSKVFRTVQLWFGGNNVAPNTYSIKYDRSIL
jgi:hypothetical protein